MAALRFGLEQHYIIEPLHTPETMSLRVGSQTGYGRTASGMASFSGFDPAALGFLRDLGEHNDRAWFEAHRADYEGLVLQPARELVVALGGRLARPGAGVRADPRVNGSILRSARDARCSADKRPYKTHLDLWFWEGDGPSRGCSGFFLRIEADRIGYGAGMHHFDKEMIAPYRAAVDDPKRGPELVRAVKKATGSGSSSAASSGSGCPRRTLPTTRGAICCGTAGWWWGRRLGVPDELFTSEFPAWCVERFRPLRPLQKWVAQVVADAPSTATMRSSAT